MWQFCCGSLYYQYQGEKTYEYYLLNSSVEPETDAQIERVSINLSIFKF